jgi:hypothetical protein
MVSVLLLPGSALSTRLAKALRPVALSWPLGIRYLLQAVATAQKLAMSMPNAGQ